MRVRRNAGIVNSLYVCQDRLSNVIVDRYRAAADAASLRRELNRDRTFSERPRESAQNIAAAFVLILASDAVTFLKIAAAICACCVNISYINPAQAVFSNMN